MGAGDAAAAASAAGAVDGAGGGAAGGASAVDEVEVITVDKCQGRDYACVVLSLVRSNGDGSSGDGGEGVGTISLFGGFSLCSIVLDSGGGTSETLDGLVTLSAGSSTTSSLNPHTGRLLDILVVFS